MDLLNALRTNQLERFKAEFTWRTKDKVTKRIPDMDTTHLFNTAKLLLNKYSPEQKASLYVRGPNSYACNSKNGQTAFFMVWEIEQRDNLDRKHRTAYANMLGSVFDPQFIFQDLPRAIRPNQTPQPQVQTEARQTSLLSRLTEGMGIQRREPVQVARPFVPAESQFVGVDYAHQEVRAIMQYGAATGRFNATTGQPPQHHNARSTTEPRSTAAREEERLGTRVFTPEHMFETISRASRRYLDLDLWLMTIPNHFREGVDWVIEHRTRMRRGRSMRGDRESIHQFIAEFQAFKTSALSANDLTRSGWVTPADYRSPSEREARRREEERRGRGRRSAVEYLRTMHDVMGERAFRDELEPLLLRSNPSNQDVIQEFWAWQRRNGQVQSTVTVTMPPPMVEEVQCYAGQTHYDINSFVPMPGIAQVYLDDVLLREGSQYLLSGHCVDLLADAVPNAGSRLRVLQRAFDRPRNRNPILMVDTESGGLRGRNADWAIFDEVRSFGLTDRPGSPTAELERKDAAKKPKIDPAQQVESLTQIGKRKIQLGDDNG